MLFTGNHTNNPPNSNAYRQNLSHMWSLHNRINTLIKTEKVDGPINHFTFLGMVLDTITMEASVSSQWKSSLLTIHLFMISSILKKCTKWVLLSIIGKLSFACKVQWFWQVASSYICRPIHQTCSWYKHMNCVTCSSNNYANTPVWANTVRRMYFIQYRLI